jgi:hypothetical protein
MNPRCIHEKLLKKIYGYILSHAIAAVTAMGVADIVGDEALHVDDIAQKTKTSAASLSRLLRFLVSEEIFESTQTDYYKNNQFSLLLTNQPDNSLGSIARLHASELWQNLWLMLPDSVRQNRSAMDIKAGMSIFEYFEKEKLASSHSSIFNSAMQNLNAMDAKYFVDSYDLLPYDNIIDIAGGKGDLIHCIADTYPDKNLALFETDAVLKQISEKRDMAYIFGDFFSAVPEGFDLYILRHIIHNWNDGEAIKLLNNCRQAMSKGGRICIIECVDDETSLSNLLRYRDMTMLVTMPSGRERSMAEFQSIVGQAGLSINKVINIHSAMNVIECINSV